MSLGDRFFQALLIGSTVALSWLGMMAVHELGHVAHLWLSGGTVEHVLLHPAQLSYTQPGENPRPLFVAAGGAVWGCGLPLLVWLIARREQKRGQAPFVRSTRRAFQAKGACPLFCSLARFFAGFCLVANGAYLGADAFIAGGDARELMAHGTPWWLLVAFGLPAVAWGMYLWHGQGENFGLGRAKRGIDRKGDRSKIEPVPDVVDRRAAVALTVTLAAVVVLELVFCNPTR